MPADLDVRFAIKRDAKGKIDKYKARLVVDGSGQVLGVDVANIFAPVVRFGTVRLVLGLAATFGLTVQQVDVTAAFVQSGMTREDGDVYMQVPKGVEAPDDGGKYVCKLEKALYGLRQAPRLWYRTVSDFRTVYTRRRLWPLRWWCCAFGD